MCMSVYAFAPVNGLAGRVVLFAFLILNLFTFLLYGIDKYKARHGQWRVSEASLLLLALLGGSLGAWAGMRVWHHKTLHKKFRYGVPLIVILQICALVGMTCTSCASASHAMAHRYKSHPTQSQSVARKVVDEEYPRTIILFYDQGEGTAGIERAMEKYGCRVLYHYRNLHGYAASVPNERAVRKLRKVRGVLAVQFDSTVQLDGPVEINLH